MPASHPELLARFAKESAMHKREMCPDIDHMDVTARQESLAVRGEPILLQLPLNPCYALTIHKTQALSIKHLVLGCLEGVFALGQVYVLFSRVTIPHNCQLVGIPPKDLIDAVAEALRAAGFDVDACFKRAATVTGEWVYVPGEGLVSHRITPKWSAERNIPLKCRTLAEVLNPQPQAAAVIRNLLGWIDRVDTASHEVKEREKQEDEERALAELKKREKKAAKKMRGKSKDGHVQTVKVQHQHEAMREKNKLAYLKEYKKAKEITSVVNQDLEFLDKVDG